MQVTGGQYKGIRLSSPIGARSTLSVVREGVFNILKSHFGEASNNKLKFLDMFTGSAIMAIEAHSRGFEALGIEKNPKIARIAKENAARCGGEVKIIVADAMRAIKNLESFDVIYLDPPWEMNYEPIIKAATEHLTPDGVIICEHDKNSAITTPEGFSLTQKKYGRARLAIFKHTGTL